jgi:hypothetical protein
MFDIKRYNKLFGRENEIKTID